MPLWMPRFKILIAILLVTLVGCNRGSDKKSVGTRDATADTNWLVVLIKPDALDLAREQARSASALIDAWSPTPPTIRPQVAVFIPRPNEEFCKMLNVKCKS